MKHQLLFTLLILCNSFAYAQEWVTNTIDKKVSVEMPRKADKEKSGAAVIFVGDNDGCAFIVTVSPLPGKVQVPAEEEKASKFLDGILDGSLKDNKPKDLEKGDFTIGNVKGKSASFRGNFPGTEIEGKATRRVICVLGTVYIFDFWLADEEYAAAKSDEEKFFSSIKIAQ
jgi:hypothetical protein